MSQRQVAAAPPCGIQCSSFRARELHCENHLITPTDAEKVSDKTQHLLTTKTLTKLRIEGNLPILTKNVYEKLQLTPHLVVRNSKLSD